MTKHTPRPWWIDDNGFIVSGSGDTYLTIADPHASNDIDPCEIEANARLMVASPDMLEKLKHCHAMMQASGMERDLKLSIGKLLHQIGGRQ